MIVFVGIEIMKKTNTFVAILNYSMSVFLFFQLLFSIFIGRLPTYFPEMLTIFLITYIFYLTSLILNNDLNLI